MYINDKTVAFIPTQQGITLFDSHFHGTSGAFLAMAPADAAWELLSWFKAVNSIPHNLGTVTCYILTFFKTVYLHMYLQSCAEN